MGVLAKAAGSLWDWIEAGYPEEVAKRIVSGELPMDEASRMARAAEQGYGDVLYRGHANINTPRSDQDMWLTDSKDVARTYANASMDRFGSTVTPLRTNADYHGPNNLAYVRGDHKMHDKVTTNSIKNPGIRQGIIKGTDDIAEAVKESGLYQGTHFRGIKDEFHTASSTDPSDVYNILGTRPDVNIRHADAAYDPKYTGPNIMGGVLAGAIGLGALSQSEEADAGVATSIVELILKKYGDDVAGATEELVRLGGFPESVARRIATGELPMDEASRVARREAQARPETYYNGGNTGALLEVDPEMSGSARGMSAETGFWGAGNGGRASGYAGNPVTENSTVYPFRVLNNSDQMVVDARGSNWNLMKGSSPVSVKHWNEGEESYGAIADWTDDYWDTNDIAHMAKDKGDFGSVLFRNVVDSAGEGSQVHIELMEMFPELKKMPYGSKQRKEFLDNLTPEQTSEAYRRAEAKFESMGDSIVVFDPNDIRSPNAAYDPQYSGPNIMGNATVPALGVLATGTGAALAAPALKSEGLEKATGFLDETIRSARHAAGPLSFLVPYEGISNFAKKWNADEDLTWQDYLGLLDF